jgi:dephospho-CoA kinase
MPALKAIREWFGDSYFAEDGALDRAKLGELVFNDADARRALNKITHPGIFHSQVCNQGKSKVRSSGIVPWPAGEVSKALPDCAISSVPVH